MNIFATIEEFIGYNMVTYYTVRCEGALLSETDNFFERMAGEVKYLESAIDLRLYCHWVNERIVILFNGGIKTTKLAQDCSNVSRHFYNAQTWVKRLNEIGIETNGRKITNLNDLYFNY